MKKIQIRIWRRESLEWSVCIPVWENKWVIPSPYFLKSSERVITTNSKSHWSSFVNHLFKIILLPKFKPIFFCMLLWRVLLGIYSHAIFQNRSNLTNEDTAIPCEQRVKIWEKIQYPFFYSYLSFHMELLAQHIKNLESGRSHHIC